MGLESKNESLDFSFSTGTLKFIFNATTQPSPPSVFFIMPLGANAQRPTLNVQVKTLILVS